MIGQPTNKKFLAADQTYPGKLIIGTGTAGSIPARVLGHANGVVVNMITDLAEGRVGRVVGTRLGCGTVLLGGNSGGGGSSSSSITGGGGLALEDPVAVTAAHLVDGAMALSRGNGLHAAFFVEER